MARIMAALLALHSFARPNMRTCVVLGSRWRLPHATAEVDVPYKARFAEEERAKRALPAKPACGSRAQRLPRRADVPTIA